MNLALTRYEKYINIGLVDGVRTMFSISPIQIALVPSHLVSLLGVHEKVLCSTLKTRMRVSQRTTLLAGSHMKKLCQRRSALWDLSWDTMRDQGSD